MVSGGRRGLPPVLSAPLPPPPQKRKLYFYCRLASEFYPSVMPPLRAPKSQIASDSALTDPNRQNSCRKKGFAARKSQIASDFPSHPLNCKAALLCDVSEIASDFWGLRWASLKVLLCSSLFKDRFQIVRCDSLAMYPEDTFLGFFPH